MPEINDTELESVRLDQIPEIRKAITELTRQRDQRVTRLIQGVATFDEYLSIAGEIRGLNHAIGAPYAPLPRP